MISQTAEYALRAVVYLAAPTEKPLTTQEIAARTQVPESYLSKVLQSLGRAGILNSQRGLHGGFSLAKKSDSLTLLEVINAIDPINPIKECPLKLENLGTNLCPLHTRINQSIEALINTFGDTTLAEILEECPDNKPLCQ